MDSLVSSPLLRWLCVISSVASILLSGFTIILHICNYRKPYEQRLTVRILLLVPIFSASCLGAVFWPQVSRLYFEPFREVYEAFVIYTFFSLLTLLLQGEKRIITELSLYHKPLPNPIPIIGRCLRKIDLSDPADYLVVKRGILQYVWFKPIYCITVVVSEIFHLDKLEFLFVILYNISMTWSLYNLAVFWACLLNELRPFNPMSKFLCVKLIIFASYWQGIIIAGISIMSSANNSSSAIDYYILQNELLCIEMVAFAVLHSIAFSWRPYLPRNMPKAGRIRFLYALRDAFGVMDLVWDFKQTLFSGSEYYNYKNLDDSEQQNLFESMNSDSRKRQLEQGIRFTDNGKRRYWIGDYGSTIAEGTNSRLQDDEEWDESICQQEILLTDPNYPIDWDVTGYKYTSEINRLRNNIQTRFENA